MESWQAALAVASPKVKLEDSPAESFLSAPGDIYSPLFSSSSMATPAGFDVSLSKVDLLRDFTPMSGDDDDSAGLSMDRDGESPSALDDTPGYRAQTVDTDSGAKEQTSDKKPTKKRKSWGQVLPEPKTNLPPRKRAKTEDEKEQRRVERVLRNRRAAQSSRERKRLEVEALEIRNKELETLLMNAQKVNVMLYEQLAQAQGKPAVVPTCGGDNSVTLSQELFSSQDGHASLLNAVNKVDLGGFLPSHCPATINPVSLSPPLNPVPDTPKQEFATEAESVETQATSYPTSSKLSSQASSLRQEQPQQEGQSLQLSPALSQTAAALSLDTVATASTAARPVAPPMSSEPSSDMTHRPAVTLCLDLPCLSPEVSQSTWTGPQQLSPVAAALFCQLTLVATLSSAILLAWSRPLTRILLSLRAGFSIPPSPAHLSSIIWLITRSSPRSWATTSTSTTSSTPTGPTLLWQSTPATRLTRSCTTLRLKLLRKILTSNPILARPLLDATMRVLRLVYSEKPLNVIRAGSQTGVIPAKAVPWAAVSGASSSEVWPFSDALPSKEALMTMLWAIRVEERKLVQARAAPIGPTVLSRSKAGMTVCLSSSRVAEKLKRKRALDDGWLRVSDPGAGKSRRLR